MLKRILKLPMSHDVALLLGAHGKSRSNLSTSSQHEKVHCSNVTNSSKQWDLLSAVCLERHPIITKPLLDIEERYQNMLHQIELENSLKCDFEVQKEREIMGKLQQQQQQGDLENKIDPSINQTTQDLEDTGEQELQNFKFAPRVNELQEEMAVTSLKRKPEKNLLLLVKQNVGNSTYLIPPQSMRKDGETMRQAADRALQESCGANLKVRIYGNAPIGFYKYRYPKEMRANGRHGAKIFYFLAKYIDGTVHPDTECMWVDRSELQGHLPDGVRESIFEFLLPD